MKVHEAIKIVKDEEWIRPVSWKGTGHAYVIKENFFYVVPTIRGGASALMNIDDLVDDWEIVSPEFVLGEV